MEIIPYKTQIDNQKLNKSKLHFQKNTRARQIFHYTSIGGLEGILKHKTLSKQSSNIDKLSLKKWEQKITDTEKKRKLNDLPIFFYNGQNCSFEKNPSGDYLYFIKRDCFKQEREFRIVITVPDEQLVDMKEKGVYKFRIGNGILVPFLELKFSSDVVKSIRISPTVQSDLVELSIEDFLKYCDFEVEDWNDFIRTSDVPVRF